MGFDTQGYICCRLVPVSIFFPLVLQVSHPFSDGSPTVQSTWCHKQVLFGTISNVFAAFIGNKTEILVEILIVVVNKILNFTLLDPKTCNINKNLIILRQWNLAVLIATPALPPNPS